jgi:hypothetical protein
MLIRLVRTSAAILAGLLVLSGLVEGLEFALVAAINGGPTTQPEIYYGIRNLPWFLGLKLIYNTAGAVVAGFLTAQIAGYAKIWHGIALAIIQSIAFAWALAQPDLRQWTPIWAWVALMLLTFAGIVYGARMARRRHAT